MAGLHTIEGYTYYYKDTRINCRDKLIGCHDKNGVLSKKRAGYHDQIIIQINAAHNKPLEFN
jgi:hypothetical protein